MSTRHQRQVSVDEIRDKVMPLLLPCGVRRVALFGSAARGELKADSDIDILVNLKDLGERPTIGLKWFGIELELSRVLGREVELVSEKALSPYLRKSVEKDLVVLYDEE